MSQTSHDLRCQPKLVMRGAVEPDKMSFVGLDEAKIYCYGLLEAV